MDGLPQFLLQTDLHLWLMLLVAIGITLYEVYAKIFKGKDLEPNVVVAIVIIPAIIGFGVDRLLNNVRTRGDIDYFIKQLEDYADCSYAQDKLGELRRDLLKFKKRQTETLNAGQTMSEIIRALSRARREAIFIDHYVLAWNDNLELLFQANLAALDRRIEIKRLFILTDEVISDKDKLRAAVAVMKRHKDAGMDVRYIRQKDLLASDLNYRLYALNNLCMIDNEVVIVVSPASQVNAAPTRALVTWDKELMHESDTSSNLLTSKYLEKFESQSEKDLLSTKL